MFTQLLKRSRRALAAVTATAVLAGSALVGVAAPASAEDAPQDPAMPTVTVSKTDALVPGETITVTGTGFTSETAGSNGARPPLYGKFGGAYVVIGKFATDWQPSTGAASSTRKVSSQKWIVDAADLPVINTDPDTSKHQGVAVAEDGTFSLELTVDKGTVAEDFVGNWGVYTYGGSGAKPASFETYTPITFAETSLGAPTYDSTNDEFKLVAQGQYPATVDGVPASIIVSLNGEQSALLSSVEQPGYSTVGTVENGVWSFSSSLLLSAGLNGTTATMTVEFGAGILADYADQSQSVVFPVLLTVNGSGFTDLPLTTTGKSAVGVYVAVVETEAPFSSYDSANLGVEFVFGGVKNAFPGFLHPSAGVREYALGEGNFSRKIAVKPEYLTRNTSIVIWAAHGNANEETLLAKIPATADISYSIQRRAYDAIQGAGELTISGAPAVGSTLTANSPVWTPSTAVSTFQWNANGVAIDGATEASYQIALKDLGKKITVTETVARPGYLSANANSNAVTVVLADAAKVTAKASVSGTAKFNSTLTAKPGTWNLSGVNFKYQWLRDGKVISGATKATYKLTSADIAKKISVKVTAVKDGYADGSSTSNAVTVAKADAAKATKAPVISGTKRFNSTLKVNAGSWNNSGLAYKYQWLRDGKSISGATKSSYKLTSKDVAKRISVKVTAVKAGHTDGSVTTARTSKIAKVTPSVSTKLSKTSIKRKQSTKITVTIKASGVSKPVGKVTVKVGKKTFTKTVKSSHKGKVTITLKNLKVGKKQKVTAKFTPSSSSKTVLNSKTSSTKRLTVR